MAKIKITLYLDENESGASVQVAPGHVLTHEVNSVVIDAREYADIGMTALPVTVEKSSGVA